MPMLNIYGITEFVGESGAGKTKLALGIEKEVKTIYLSIDNSGTPPLSPNVIHFKIKTFIELKVFVAKELKRVAKVLEIKKIIIDGLENYLYTVEQPRKMANDIFRIIKVLRYLCFVKKIYVIVINSSYGKWNNEGVSIANRYFGLPWEYLINTRFLISRHSKHREVIELNSKEKFTFFITDSGIEFETHESLSDIPV